MIPDLKDDSHVNDAEIVASRDDGPSHSLVMNSVQMKVDFNDESAAQQQESHVLERV